MSATYDPADVDDELPPEELPPEDPPSDDSPHDEGGDHRTDEEFGRVARAQGWVEHPRNPAVKALTAKEFVLRGETILPLVRAENRRLQGQLDTMERSLADQKAALEAMTNLARRADERGYKRALAEAETRLDQATEVGDVAAARQIRAEIDTLKDERVEAPALPPAPPPPPNGMDPDIAAFIEENASWFKTSAPMRDAMFNFHQLVRIENPNLTMVEQLAEAKQRLQAMFPAQFPTARRAPAADPPPGDLMPEPRRPAAASVMRSGGAPPAPRAVRGPFEQIADAAERATAKAEFAKVQRASPQADPEEFVAIWNDPHLDLMQWKAQRKK